MDEDKHKTSKPVQKKESKNSEITIETNNYPDTKLALIDASPSELMNICKEHTTAEAEMLLAPFIGRLIVIKAKVNDVSVRKYGLGGYMMSLEDQDSDTTIFAHFDKEWNEVVSTMRKGQHITVLGKIDDINKLWIGLESCSIAQGIVT